MTPEQTFFALQKLARNQSRAVQEILTLYVLEQFLARLVGTEYADSFVLKGGVLLAGFGFGRPMRHVDMRAVNFVLDEDRCRGVVAAVAAVPADDGVTFDPVPSRIEQIRDEEEYLGLRVHLNAQLFSRRLTPKLDIRTGHPISPQAQTVTMPRLLLSTCLGMLALGDDRHRV